MTNAIAIDGPAGAGKSTIAKLIAKKLDYIYLDTGAMYRACALKAIKNNIDCNDENLISKMMDNTIIEIKYTKENQEIYLDDENVTAFIRTAEVSKGASDISAIPSVRLKMVDLQRRMAKGNNVILDGRDIGTFVLPNANHKIYLNASVDERAKRRFLEIKNKGEQNITLEQVKKDIEYRDYNDSNRKLAPLKKAEDAIEIDTTSKTIKQVTDEIISIIKKNA